MTLTFVPQLQIQRNLYDLPRNMERFHAYLATMRDATTGDLKFPLVAMNPMAGEHVPALLDAWMALGADEIAATAVRDAEERLRDVAGEFRVALVIADDLRGRWTNRYEYEFGHRVGSKPFHRRGWLTGMLWTTETPSSDAAREAASTSVYRAAYIQRQGYARTLRDTMAQEGYAMASAGCTTPALDADDLEYTRNVMARYLDATDQPTLMTCLFGDKAVAPLGFAPLGFSDGAGLALALADAGALRSA